MIGALCLVPTPVRETAVSDVAFLAVGLSSTAWTGSATFADREGVRKARVVVLGPAADARIVLHEVAHGWHSEVPHAHSQLITTTGEAKLLALATRDGWRPHADAFIARGERLADACALVWGAPR